MQNKIILLLFLIVTVSSLDAQIKSDEDTTAIIKNKGFFRPIYNYAEKTIFQYLDKSDQAPSDKPFNFSVIGGPYYTNETKIGLGIIGSGLFKLKDCETDSIPSNISLYTNVTTSGAYAVGIQGNIYFPGKKYWINADVSFSDTPSQYWGIGYYSGRNAYYTDYNIQRVQAKVNFFKKVQRYTSVALTASANDIRGKYFHNVSLLEGQKRKNTAMGVGIYASYDSRDVITEPYKGMYIILADTFYPNFAGNTRGFNKSQITFRYYKQLWTGSVLAFDIDGFFSRGDVPWNMLELAGNASQMRGYYTGRYRDKNLAEAQVELRQHIYKRSGAVVWIGGGNIFPGFKNFKLDETLPTYGIGYRFRVKPRTNLRFDYGFGKGTSAFYININEAF